MSAIDEVLAKLHGVKGTGKNAWAARCPCRTDDDNPSLSVGIGRDGRVLLNCHRGENACGAAEICEAMGLTMADLHDEKPKKAELKLVDTYIYADENGEVLFRKQKYVDEANGNKKTFRQQRHENGSWVSGRGQARPVLFNLPEVKLAIEGQLDVWVVEGEKDAEAVNGTGRVATTMPDGAGHWQPLHTAQMKGAKRVIVCADNDEIGIEHAWSVHDALEPVVGKVIVVTVPEGKDAFDWIHKHQGDLSEVVPINRPGALALPLVKDDFSEIVEGLVALAATDAPAAQKLMKARNLIDRADVHDEFDRGRLVVWTDFVSETTEDSYDWVIPGVLERQERVIVVAAEGVGKMLPLDTPIPTPSGWTTMGDLAVGDEVIDRHGSPCRVVATTSVESTPKSYVIRFSDGVEQVACADHQWVTVPYEFRQPARRGDGPPLTWPTKTVTTAEIRATLRARGGHVANHAIPVNGVLDLPEADLTVAPYTLGVWLGDGHSADAGVTLSDRDAPQILERLRAEGETPRLRPSSLERGACKGYGLIGGLQVRLRELGVLGNKHIPAAYLRGSARQRLALLQGLMDTDGYIAAEKRGSTFCELTFTHEPLARDAVELIRTLGMAATITESECYIDGKYISQRWRIIFQPHEQVFTVTAKAERFTPLRTYRSQLRYIVAVEPVEPVPMRCISVDSPDNTYLCGEHFIPTHNTTLARQVAICTAAGLQPFTRSAMDPITTLFVDLENPERIIRRMSRDIVGAAQRYRPDKKAPIGAHLLMKPDGMNLLDAPDRMLLEETIEAIKPDLLVIGPLYKAFIDPGGRTSESVAVETAKYLDYLRWTYGCALWMEHHAPLGGSGGRDMRPFGSAVWSRWPEFGLTITPDFNSTEPNHFNVGTFRGSRDVRHWPTKVKWGQQFPFDVLEYVSTS